MKKPVNNYFNKVVNMKSADKKFDLKKKNSFGSKTPNIPSKIVRKKMFIKNDDINKIRFIEKKKVERAEVKTGWGGVASWYDATINSKSSTQKDIILPALMSFMPLSHMEGREVLDLGCGTGFFMGEYIKGNPKKLSGIDVDNELLAIAHDNLHIHNKYNIEAISLIKEDAEKLISFKDSSLDLIFSIEAVVNMKDLSRVAGEISRTLKPGGKFVMLVNHPAFRVPQSADWHYDESKKRQGRVVYKYKTAHSIKIDMNPGSSTNKQYTYTFHRSVEDYVNTFMKLGMLTRRVKEVYSDKKSDKNAKRKNEEDLARLEIPMFMIFEFVKI
jgi:ubiquinone/menaquinone biosynthesis C-methylase UbiE